MTMDAPLVLPPDGRSPVRRWILAATVVVLVHAGFVYWLSRRVVAPNAAGAPESAIMIELPPMTVARPATASEVPPGPEMKEAEPEPQPEPETVEPPPIAPELPPAPAPEAVLVAPQKPPTVEKPRVEPKPAVQPRKPVEKQTPKSVAKPEAAPRAPRTTAPRRQSVGAPGQTSAAASHGAANSSASAGAWQALVSAQVNRNTSYPSSAQGATGASAVRFSIDRSGRLISASLSKSAGSPALDAEAVATVRRASPFPPPPSDIPGARFNFTKTINFRRQ